MIFTILNWILNSFIMALFLIIRPLLGPAECKYSISCMHFARNQFRHLPTHKALWRICRRVFSCAPWARIQEDLIL